MDIIAEGLANFMSWLFADTNALEVALIMVSLALLLCVVAFVKVIWEQ